MEAAHRRVERDSSTLLAAVTDIAAGDDLDTVLRRVAATACRLLRAEYAVVTTLDDDAVADLVSHGDPPDDLPAPRGGPTGPARLTVPLEYDGHLVGRIHVGPAPDDAELLARLATAVAPVVDRARALDLSERRRAWQQATAAVTTALAPARDLADALDALVATLHQVTGAGRVAALHRDSHAELAVAGTDPALDLTERLAAVAGIVRVAQGDSATLIVPLPTERAPVGVLLLQRAGSWAVLRGLERELLVSFAGQVGAALDRARTAAAREGRVLAGERDRIARDLHDLVVQRLYAVGMRLQGARRDPARLDDVVGSAVTELDQVIRDLRATIFELGHGGGLSLREEVRALVGEYAGVLGFVPSLRHTGPVDAALSAEAAGQVLLTLREALSNIARHAGAGSARIELTASREWFMLRVVDDGTGLPTALGHGSGLANARHRADKLGGVMRLGPAHPRGTSLAWLIPASR
ncbi:GAF domain-containing sensor histidine kinase [Nocardioides sp.]|uniref:sensor histidine kinase n=1 Tax=Nocardioides sp. TaxID=35761 RepID=UPI0039E3AA32